MIIDLLFPPFCIGCRRIGTVVCSACFRGVLPVPNQVCPYCFQSSPNGVTHMACRQNAGLDGALALIRYTQTGKKLITQLKYHLAYRSFSAVASRFPDRWFEVHRSIIHSSLSPVFQPIPLHPRRQKKRGFNQADIIAHFFEKKTGIPRVDILKRIKDTTPQAHIQKRGDRYLNIKGAFEVTKNSDVQDTTIVLVDDLFTSGSTAKEAARMLKEAGARHVFVFTVAHG